MPPAGTAGASTTGSSAAGRTRRSSSAEATAAITAITALTNPATLNPLVNAALAASSRALPVCSESCPVTALAPASESPAASLTCAGRSAGRAGAISLR